MNLVQDMKIQNSPRSRTHPSVELPGLFGITWDTRRGWGLYKRVGTGFQVLADEFVSGRFEVSGKCNTKIVTDIAIRYVIRSIGSRRGREPWAAKVRLPDSTAPVDVWCSRSIALSNWSGPYIANKKNNKNYPWFYGESTNSEKKSLFNWRLSVFWKDT